MPGGEAVAEIPRGAALELARNPHSGEDPNARRVEHDGTVLGRLAPEIASPLALVLDPRAKSQRISLNRRTPGCTTNRYT